MSKQVPVSRWSRAGASTDRDRIAEEEPLEILIAWSFKDRRETAAWGITLRTPGNDRELVLGLLFGEGQIRDAADVESVEELEGARIRVSLASHVDYTPRAPRLVTAACGFCGTEEMQEPAPEQVTDPFRIAWPALQGLPERLRGSQPGFSETGAVHGAALFDVRGELVQVREDVGRHNAVDKLIGWALQEGRLPASEFGLLLSGRAGFELVQKAGRAGIPMIAAIGGTTTFAVRTARGMGQTLVAFLRQGKATLYTGPQRLL